MKSLIITLLLFAISVTCHSQKNITISNEIIHFNTIDKLKYDHETESYFNIADRKYVDGYIIILEDSILFEYPDTLYSYYITRSFDEKIIYHYDIIGVNSDSVHIDKFMMKMYDDKTGKVITTVNMVRYIDRDGDFTALFRLMIRNGR